VEPWPTFHQFPAQVYLSIYIKSPPGWKHIDDDSIIKYKNSLMIRGVEIIRHINVYPASRLTIQHKINRQGIFYLLTLLYTARKFFFLCYTVVTTVLFQLAKNQYKKNVTFSLAAVAYCEKLSVVRRFCDSVCILPLSSLTITIISFHKC
jgi:hypothetical protein